MAQKVLLCDWSTGEFGLIKAGELIDDGESRFTALFSSGAPFADYTAPMDPIIAAYRNQVKILPQGVSHVDLTAALEALGLVTPPGQGDVTGTGPVVADTIAVQSGTTGKAIKGSLVGVTASGSVTLPALETVDGRDVSVDGTALDAAVADITTAQGDILLRVLIPSVTAVQTGPTFGAALDTVVLVDTTGAGVQVDLPTAIGVEGRGLTVKKVAGANDVTIDGLDAETIDGAATKVIAGAATGRDLAIPLVSDGANWISL